MVRLIAHILSEMILGKGHSQLHQMHKALYGQRRLTECMVPVHTLAGKEIPGHGIYAVRLIPGQRQLIVGLLIRTRIAGGAGTYPLGNQCRACLSILKKAVRRGESGGSAAGHQCVVFIQAARSAVHFKLLSFHSQSLPFFFSQR